MEKTRIECFDIAKGIGILCIIAGHMGIESVINAVFTFHVPLFFLISGYFISFRGSYLSFVKKKAVSLLIPVLFTIVCLILIRIPYNYLILKTPGMFVPEMKNIIVRGLYGAGWGAKNLWGIGEIGAIWFLHALFWAMVWVRFAATKKSAPFLVGAVALISYWLSNYVWLPMSIQAAGTASVFVYIGTLIKKYKKDMFETFDKPTFLAGLVSFVMSYILCIQTGINSNYYCHGAISVITSVLISCAVIYLSKLIEKFDFPRKALLFFGQNSVIILCFHLVEQNNFRWWLIYDFFNDFAMPLNLQHVIIFMMKVAFSAVCTFIVLKVRFLRKIFSK